eukprot:GHVU01026604.1.p1 GENE.GHVU01026604.1~~GHVU01026604.1.p1  ORF type:complete len:166 (+),score=14.29 GHVU01026604.1:68-499(+)
MAVDVDAGKAGESGSATAGLNGRAGQKTGVAPPADSSGTAGDDGGGGGPSRGQYNVVRKANKATNDKPSRKTSKRKACGSSAAVCRPKRSGRRQQHASESGNPPMEHEEDLCAACFKSGTDCVCSGCCVPLHMACKVRHVFCS